MVIPIHWRMRMSGFGWNWLRRNNKASSSTSEQIDRNNVPEHVAIIMDGNGRWAKKRGLPRAAGHRSGMGAVKRVTMAANDIGVKTLTLYAFSTENWKRPKDEVDYLMKLPEEFLSIELEELIRNNVQIRMMGWKEGLPAHTLSAVEEAERQTRQNTGLVLNFALNYGGRREIVDGMKRIAKQVQEGVLRVEDIAEETISNALLTTGLPDPDLLIRTSGELRISNFMLWQIAYSELAFVDVYWPDFTTEHFYEVISQYQLRNRRFGAV